MLCAYTHVCTRAKHIQPYKMRTLHRTQRFSACSGARSPRPGCARAAEIARSYVHEWVGVCMHVCLRGCLRGCTRVGDTRACPCLPAAWRCRPSSSAVQRFRHLPAHACCGQVAEAVAQFQRAVAKALKLDHDVDVTVAEDCLMVALFPVRGPLPAATVGTPRHARCPCTAEARLRR